MLRAEGVSNCDNRVQISGISPSTIYSHGYYAFSSTDVFTGKENIFNLVDIFSYSCVYMVASIIFLKNYFSFKCWVVWAAAYRTKYSIGYQLS